MSDRRRALPSVDALLRESAVARLLESQPRSLVVGAVRAALDAVRKGAAQPPVTAEGWASAVAGQLAVMDTPTLKRVVNATGVVLHTNLGRAPLAKAALQAMEEVGRFYSTLEYDPGRGARGTRHVHCAALLCQLTGAQDAMVVNNAASALLLALAATVSGRGVAISRGELIEIGGGFRIPEILAQSGATLVEVGTTNRTRISDYERAISGGRAVGIGAILKVHRSNFRMDGFTEEADLRDLVTLGRKRRVSVIHDVGSGLMLDLSAVGLPGEPTLIASVKAGATAVIASGDKLLGGPQAGLLLGTRRFIAACRSHPLARAVRTDKVTLAALTATLRLYRDPEAARREIPILRMLHADVPGLEAQAGALAERLPSQVHPRVVPTRAAVGGGSFPGIELESRAVALRPPGLSAAELARRLRVGEPCVVAVVKDGAVLLDVRTLLEGDQDLVARAVRDALPHER